MLIKLSIDCNECSYSDKGQIVDASVNVGDGYPAAVYICKDGIQWNVSSRDDFEALNVVPANMIEGQLL